MSEAKAVGWGQNMLKAPLQPFCFQEVRAPMRGAELK